MFQVGLFDYPQTIQPIPAAADAAIAQEIEENGRGAAEEQQWERIAAECDTFSPSPSSARMRTWLCSPAADRRRCSLSAALR